MAPELKACRFFLITTVVFMVVYVIYKEFLS